MQTLIKAVKNSSNKTYNKNTMSNNVKVVNPNNLFSQEFIPPERVFPITPVNKIMPLQPELNVPPSTTKNDNQAGISQKEQQAKPVSEINKKNDSKPIELKYPEFLLFRINKLNHRIDDLERDFEEKLRLLDDEFMEFKQETMENINKITHSLSETQDLIIKMNRKLPEYIDMRITEEVMKVNEEVNNIQTNVNNMMIQTQQQISAILNEMNNMTQIINLIIEKLTDFENKLNRVQEELENQRNEINHLKKVEVLNDNSLVDPVIEFSFLTNIDENDNIDNSEVVDEASEIIGIEQDTNSFNTDSDESLNQQPEDKIIEFYEQKTREFLDGDSGEFVKPSFDFNKSQLTRLVEELSDKRRIFID